MDEKLTSARRGRFGGFSLKTCFSASAFGDSLRFASLCVCGMGVLDEVGFCCCCCCCCSCGVSRPSRYGSRLKLFRLNFRAHGCVFILISTKK